MTVTLTTQAPKTIPANIADAFDQAFLTALDDALALVASEARSNAPSRTGALRRSIEAERPRIVGNTITGVVSAGGAGAPYAKGVEFGTGTRSMADDSSHAPIVIRPVRAGALAWRGPSGMRFARRVVQQGQSPNPYLTTALEDSAPAIDALVQQAIDNVLDALSR